MDWLTFIVEIFKALAWPAVVLYVIIHYRDKFAALLPNLQKLEAGPLKAEFGAEAAKVLEEAETIRIQEGVPDNMIVLSADENGAPLEIDHILPEKRPERVNKLFALTQPTAAILLAWDNIETAMKMAIERHGVYVSERHTQHPHMWLNALAKQGLVTEETYTLVNELRDLRNRVAHVKLEPTPEAAWDYVQASDRLVPTILKQAERSSK
ncbi:hypothetical protein QTI51_23685 [Variovorax sp. J22G73]|jgi:hypothetical protein|uniref:hypothetical protein n=1 Tax=unclassified Variovorax TaxID=663243 RepID=UPI000D5EF0F2|nr:MULTISPECIES: hypothetical protein [unclassified Variovorax]MDM0008077.1 hypothetical protein [Variovorax sp. J22R203]MDM0100301.1 hypothetical protein [Variovorax sp. J22G73]